MRILLQWHHTPDHDTSDAQVIIGMAFGANMNGHGQPPGASNEDIARIIHRLWTARKIPVITQREVAEAMEVLHFPIRPALVISEQPGQFHIDSREVLFKAWEFCRQHKLRTAIIVAHPMHILRSAWVAQKLGFRVRLPDVSTVPYEPNSSQWWTRNPLFFFIWELKSRIGWKLMGYL